MILHLISSVGMFTKDYYAFIADNFGRGEHAFLARYENHPNFDHGDGPRPDVHQVFSFRGLRAAYRADGIVIHGLMSPNVLLFFYFQPWLLKKCNWVIFGGDIYGMKRDLHGVARIVDRVFRRMRKQMYPRIAYASSISTEDYEYAREHFGVTAKRFAITYPVPATAVLDDLQNALSSRSQSLARSRPIRIQIGNSATDTNHHIEALDWLAHLRDEDIEIFMPLNYGAEGFKEYASRVITHARNIFGDKVRPLLEQVDGQEYLRMLEQVDIGVFNNDRQQGTGNISQLILTGAKIYMRPEVSMWAHFQKLGCRFADIREIERQSFEQFLEYSEADRRQNVDVIRGRHSLETKIAQWSTVFDTMLAELAPHSRVVS